jgi:hypothetical protein
MRGSPELSNVLRDAFQRSVRSGLASKKLPM